VGPQLYRHQRDLIQRQRGRHLERIEAWGGLGCGEGSAPLLNARQIQIGDLGFNIGARIRMLADSSPGWDVRASE